jgi:hypothetical protein
MRIRPHLAGLALAVASVTAVAAQQGTFEFQPMPRWAEEQETETVCEAVRVECAGILKDGGIDADWGYAEVYNAELRLVGVRSVKSTGCKPLDEHLLLGQRSWVGKFADGPGQDFDGEVALEFPPGVDRKGFRLIKQGSTSVSFGCG